MLIKHKFNTRYHLPLPIEASEGAPWYSFSSEETIGVVLTRKVDLPALVLQEPLEAITPPSAIVYPIQQRNIQTSQNQYPLIEEIFPHQ